MYILGRMYEQRLGRVRNYEKALYWYRRAAERGHPKAAMDVAKLERLVDERPVSANPTGRKPRQNK
jgi:TPR repeat protein